MRLQAQGSVGRFVCAARDEQCRDDSGLTHIIPVTTTLRASRNFAGEPVKSGGARG